jgi:YVTN family beta-propeller protein
VVLNSGDSSVSLVDTKTYRETERHYIGREPHHLLETPDDRSVVVADSVGNQLIFLNPQDGSIQERRARISDPYQIGFSPDGKWFVTNSNRLDRVDLYQAGDFSLVKRLELPKTPSHLAFDHGSSVVFVTLQGSNLLAAIDLKTQEVRWQLPVGKQPAGVLMTPDDKFLLVGVMGEDLVAVVDWRRAEVIKRLPTGKGAHNFLPMGDGRRVLVSNRAANSISVIDTQSLSVETTFAVPGGPDCMELSKDGKELWITSRWIRQVSVIDMQTKKLVHSIPVGRSPHGVYFLTHAARM